MSLFSFFKRQDSEPTSKKTTSLKEGLQRTHYRLRQGLRKLTQGSTIVDQHWQDMLDVLISADTGLETAEHLVEMVKKRCTEDQVHDPEKLLPLLREACLNLFNAIPTNEETTAKEGIPYTLLLIGINGSGKTTTAAKLAHYHQTCGQKPMLAAGDTFRAAAIEQLQIWGERHNIPVVAQSTGSDSAAVIFDAIQSAKAKGHDVLIADTAGRLHNAANLRDELKKVKRVMQKIDASLPHRTYLVLDANLGQSSLNQARDFDASMGIDGVVMTKLDGTAKGGALLALAHQLQKPILWLGMGEGVDDLIAFDASAFVDQLLATPTE